MIRPEGSKSNSMEEQQELIMNVGEEEEEGGKQRPSSWRKNCDQTEEQIEEHRIDIVEICRRVKN